MLPRASWKLVKANLHRRPAFRVTRKERVAIRAAREMVLRLAPSAAERCHLLPISSMQWSSVTMGVGDESIAIVDLEQANALSFFMARTDWLEHPIFTYVEFMIRAAEVLYDDGDLVLAYRVAHRANRRLQAYARTGTMWPNIPRPQAINADLPRFMESHAVLRGITAHELAHVMQNIGTCEAEPIFDAAEEAYHSAKYEEGRFAEGMIFNRYSKPDIIQKFVNGGFYDGDITLGVRLAERDNEITRYQINEVQADAIGLIAMTEAAASVDYDPEKLFRISLSNVEITEYLVALRRILPRLPRRTRDGHVLLQDSTLSARQSTIVRFVQILRDRPELAPEVAAYWSELSQSTIDFFEEWIANSKMEQIARRGSILARGGIHFGLAGQFPPYPDEDYFRQMPPQLRGDAIFKLAHLRVPSNFFCIEETYNEEHDPNSDPVPRGFSSALRDLADLSATEETLPGDVTRTAILRDGKDARFIEVLRSARTQVVNREIDLNWSAGFDCIFSRYIRAI